MLRFLLNDQLIETALPPGSVVLDFVRYHRHLTGTKAGCREGDCGACTVLVGELKDGQLQYQSMTSCLMPLGNAQGKHIVTVEGLSLGRELNPVQQLVVDEGGTQCGFCTPGFVVSLSGFCLSRQQACTTNAIAAMDGNICRCTGYKSLERVAAQLAEKLQQRPEENTMEWLLQEQMLPAYFSGIAQRLQQLQEQQVQPPAQEKPAKVYVGGGTDLYVQRPEEMHHSPVQLLYDRHELNGVWRDNGRCFVGGAATVSDLRHSPDMQQIFPHLEAFTKLISSTPIRNMGTVAGNFINASPIGDLTIFFLALDSTLLLGLEGQTRELKLRQLYKGYKTLDKKPEEQVLALYFEVPDANTRFNFEKVSKRTHLDIASVNSALQISTSGSFITGAHLSAGGVGPIPKYLERTSAFLANKNISEELLQEANELLQEEISPISDARGTETYKRLLLRQLLYAHFITLYPELVGEELLA